MHHQCRPAGSFCGAPMRLHSSDTGDLDCTAGHTGTELEPSPLLWFLLIQLLLKQWPKLLHLCQAAKWEFAGVQDSSSTALGAQKHPCELFHLPFTLSLSSAPPDLVDMGTPRSPRFGHIEKVAFPSPTQNRAVSSRPTRLSHPLVLLLLHATMWLCASPLVGRRDRVLT